MWTSIKDFFTEWLGSTLEIPIPFTNGSTMDLVDVVGLFILFFILIWIMCFIKRIIDSIFQIF